MVAGVSACVMQGLAMRTYTVYFNGFKTDGTQDGDSSIVASHFTNIYLKKGALNDCF